MIFIINKYVCIYISINIVIIYILYIIYYNVLASLYIISSGIVSKQLSFKLLYI